MFVLRLNFIDRSGQNIHENLGDFSHISNNVTLAREPRVQELENTYSFAPQRKLCKKYLNTKGREHFLINADISAVYNKKITEMHVTYDI